ncbi:hypothetical protein Bca4012_079953 [Brassica carinata]
MGEKNVVEKTKTSLMIRLMIYGLKHMHYVVASKRFPIKHIKNASAAWKAIILTVGLQTLFVNRGLSLSKDGSLKMELEQIFGTKEAKTCADVKAATYVYQREVVHRRKLRHGKQKSSLLSPVHRQKILISFGMMKWGKKKPVSSSSSPGLSRAHHVSWFSKLTGSSDLKLAKEKKKQDDDEASQKMSSKSSLSSTKRRNDTHESSKRLQRVSAEKENATTRSANMESNEKFEEIMSSVRKKVRDFQRETMDGDKETVIMTPRIQVNRDRQQRCERRDQKLLEQKPKRPEQNTEVKVKKPARRTGTSNSRETLVAHQWQHLKETKLREVKLKADKQRKSMYLRRELGTKENSQVRVFSPRSSEKCRVKAIEDLKKAKQRAKEQEMENESFAVVKCSSDPQKDFRDSMIEMIMENGINRPEELKELLVCYLRLNSDEYHDMIINVFQQVHNDLLMLV